MAWLAGIYYVHFLKLLLGLTLSFRVFFSVRASVCVAFVARYVRMCV